ncbi:Hypothetical protein A7982_11008 [Minicystis rosea]|nr:Hypothetical protein A7982_11008 [Minicystis rosea]
MALAMAAALWASSPRAVHASGDTAIAGAVLVVFGVDVGLTSYDVFVAAKGRLPTRAGAITEIALVAPQSVLVTGGLTAVVLDNKRSEPALALIVIPPMWINAMTTHGIWGAATDRVRPELLPALSLMVGANATLTTFALGHAFSQRLLSRPLGVAAMALTAPQLAVAIPAAIKSDRDRNAWIGAASWSGALFVHGLVSTILAPPEPDPPIAPPPPPPPDVPEKPPLLVPASIRLAPTMIVGERGSAPGLVLTGTLF